MRESGILMHITSLPGPYGIGTMGKAAYAFADFLEKAGQSYWQILPLTPTGYGNSPYQSFSSCAGNYYLIDLDILIEKAQQGVEVRFMYDGMCAFTLLPYNYPEKLKKYDIKCKMSNKIRPFVSTVQNNRDHRKICVIDGKVGFTGGVNLADEYINRKVRFGHWKDTAIMLRGDAVQSLTIIFLQMWNVDERGLDSYARYLTPKREGLRREMGYVIPYADSPFDNENVGEEVYFHILNHAFDNSNITVEYK